MRAGARPAMLLAAVALASQCYGIVTRDDVGEERFYKPQGLYPCAFSYDPEHGALQDCGCSCGATMIAPNWAITAAHCFAQGPTKLDGKVLQFRGRERRVDRVFLHPCGLEANDRIDRGQDNIPNKDVALIQFTDAVETDSAICPLYPLSFGSERGKRVTIVGTGLSGVANMPDEALRCDWRVRQAENVVEESIHSMIRMRFDSPRNRPLPLEGIAGDGDSGGPAFITVDGTPYVAGVSSFGDPTGSNGRPRFAHRKDTRWARPHMAPEEAGSTTDNRVIMANRTRTGHCLGRRHARAMRRNKGDVWGYGSMDFYAAVSDVRDWIAGVMTNGQNDQRCTDYDGLQ